jgi:hypothetical protein
VMSYGLKLRGRMFCNSLRLPTGFSENDEKQLSLLPTSVTSLSFLPAPHRPLQTHPLNVYLNSDSSIEKELKRTFIIFGFTAMFRSGEFKCLFDMNCERDENNLHEILN